MRPRYAELEAARLELKALYERIGRRLKREPLPPESAKEITEAMVNAGYMLRNPAQLGAFDNAGQIIEQTAKTKQLTAQLARIDALVPAAKP